MELKSQMFSQFASSGLNELLKEFQTRYAPKKGMRFNKENITHEIGAPKVTNSFIEYEISSKIPQDEVPNQKGKESYFQEVKKIILKQKDKPVSIEMDNIVWDAEKVTEKKREYVKLVYRYPFETLYDEKKIIGEARELKQNPGLREIPKIPGIMTTAGKLVLVYLKENLSKTARKNIEAFIEANEVVRKAVNK